MHTPNNRDIRNQIFEDLRRKIFSGELQYEDRLIETQIAEQYQVNKANVRQVLQQLQNQGLVDFVSMKGFVVLGISKEDLLEIAKIREMLESAIMEDFLQNASDEDIEEVKLYTKRKIALLQAGLREESYKETLATFNKIHECTSYQRIAKMLKEYQAYIEVMIRLAVDMPKDLIKSTQNTMRLYEALDTRNDLIAKEWVHTRYLNVVNVINCSHMFQKGGGVA